MPTVGADTQGVVSKDPPKTAVLKRPAKRPLSLFSRRLLSISFWLFITFSSLVIFPFAVLVWLLTFFDRRRVILHQFTCLWGSLYTWSNPAWPITIEGREKIRRGVPYVMVANHQSLLDILVLFRLFRHFKWVSKVENFRVPCIGWNMSMNGYIKLVRGNQASVAQMLRACAKTLGQGNPIMMFPEGTRSRDGKLRKFKTGAFTLAQRANVPILPIVIEGSGNALPKAGFILQGLHPIKVRVLDELGPEDWPEGASAQELADHIREIFRRELGEA